MVDKKDIKIGDHIKLKNPTYYGYEKRWIITYIYKDGSFVLRNADNEDETLERYSSEDIRVVKK